MSTVPPTSPVHPLPSAAGLSSPLEAEPRATFGWRPGTVRGLLSLLVLGLLWSVALFSPEWNRDQQIPLVYLYLQYLLVLIIAYYFPPVGSVARRSSTDKRILRLWPEIVPWVLVVGSLGLAVWVWQSHREYFYPKVGSFMLPLAVLGGFFAGHALSWVLILLAGGRLPPWLQDLQAWIALVAMLALVAELMLHLFIIEGITDPKRQEEIGTTIGKWDGIVAGLVAFYYGARSESPRVSS